MYKKRRNSVKSIQRLQEFKANSSIALEDLKCKELVLLLKKHNVDKSTINKMRTNVERGTSRHLFSFCEVYVCMDQFIIYANCSTTSKAKAARKKT